MATYKILTVSPAGDFQGRGGKMLKYLMSLEDEKGVTAIATLNQQEKTPAPVVGTTIEGSIEQTSFGPKFNKETNNPNFTGGAKSGGYVPNPKDTESIENQVALKESRAIMDNEWILKHLPKEATVEDFVKMQFSFFTAYKRFLRGSTPPSVTKPVVEEPVQEHPADYGDEPEIDLQNLPF